MEKVSIKCKVAVSGNVRAKLLYSKDSFCFWGGADPQSGLIRDNRSDCYGNPDLQRRLHTGIPLTEAGNKNHHVQFRKV